MEVKRVRVSVACDACKKRRGKCAGTSPCDYCAEHNVPCCFSTKSKKRGPASKHPKISPSSTPSSSSSNSNSNSSNSSAPPSSSPTPAVAPSPSSPNARDIEDMLGQFAFLPNIPLQNVMAPSNLHQHLLRFAVLSHVARNNCDIDRATEFFGTARQIAGQIYDTLSPSPSISLSSPSSPSLSPFSTFAPSPFGDNNSNANNNSNNNSTTTVAFVLLAQHCMLERDPRAIHFAHLARSHSKEMLNMKEWRAALMVGMTYVMTVTLDESLTVQQKHDLLHHYIATIKKSDHSCINYGAGTLMQVVDPVKVSREGLLAALHDISYSREIHDRLVQDIERVELLLNANFVSCPSHKLGLLVLVKMYKTLVDLWSGNYSLVCISGREMLDLAKRPEMDELMRNNTMLSTLIPNLSNFGTIQIVMSEAINYYIRPTHDNNLAIHPNISSLLGNTHHSFHSHSSFYPHTPLSDNESSGACSPSSDISLSHSTPPIVSGEGNSSPVSLSPLSSSGSISPPPQSSSSSSAPSSSSSSSSSTSLSCSPHAPPLRCRPHAPALLVLSSTSSSASPSSTSSPASPISPPSSPASPFTPPSSGLSSPSSNNNLHLPSISPLKHAVPNPSLLDNYSLSNFSVNPLSLPTLSSLHNTHGLPSLHSLPLSRPSGYAPSPHICNYIIPEMPPIKINPRQLAVRL